MKRLSWRSWAVALIIVIIVGSLMGCRSVPDEMPAEQALPQSFADLLPESTVMVMAISPSELRQMAGQVPGMGMVVQSITASMPPVMQDLLSREGIDGRDPNQPFYYALPMTGHDELLEALRLGAPLTDESLLPKIQHSRLVIPADNAVTLADALLAKCEARKPGCGEFVAVEAFGSFVTIDMAQTNSGDFVSSEWDEAASIATARPVDTVAFRAFAEAFAETGAETGADDRTAIAIHARFDRVFDAMALMQLNMLRFHLNLATDDAHRRQLLTELSVKAAREYLFDSPGTEEFEDVTLRITHAEGAVTIDSVLSLTAYGTKVTNALELESALATRTLAEPALDVRWGFDLTGAIKATERPLWAQDVPGMAPEPFANMMDWKTKRSPIGFPLAVLRAPVTGYALFDKFVGDQTTPADFAQIRGFWMQLGLATEDVGVAAMGLDLPVGADIVSFEQFADVALLPFGQKMETRAVEREANLEFQATTGQAPAQIFTDGVETIGPGVSIVADLHRLYALFQVLDKPSDGEEFDGISHRAQLLSPAFLPAKYRKVFVQALVGQGQGVMRLEFGAQAPTAIALRPDAPAPRAIPERSPCLYRALEYSVLAIEEMEQTGPNPDAYAVLVEDVATGLDGLAQECAASEPEAAQTISEIAAAWRQAK